ncbi:MAG: hypothetical protein H6858_03410 [Rhodospirillales bacterium]|nr:hypothetical protein [Saprospiraceae bacterium]MCB1681035.1 hypothetical protein [Alphaproteobacteria bacterium]MCB9976631.1 hypothetical protein [Rhodospirillales bacterium]
MDDPDTNRELWAYKDQAVELTNTALGHYDIHRQIVLKKLNLARKAALASEKKRSRLSPGSLWKWLKTFSLNSLSSEKKEHDVWGEIIGLFSTNILYEDDLFQIEALLEKMPKQTYQVFLDLLKQDKDYAFLNKNLKRDAYQQAKKKIENVQRHKNPLTGLSPEDYERGLLRHLKSLLLTEV